MNEGRHVNELKHILALFNKLLICDLFTYLLTFCLLYYKTIRTSFIPL